MSKARFTAIELRFNELVQQMLRLEILPSLQGMTDHDLSHTFKKFWQKPQIFVMGQELDAAIKAYAMRREVELLEHIMTRAHLEAWHSRDYQAYLKRKTAELDANTPSLEGKCDICHGDHESRFCPFQGGL